MIAINTATSEEHARACLKYMELLYTDRQFRDLLAYGIEGEHFNYYEGTVIRTAAGSENYLMDNFVTGPAVSASVVSASEELLADPDQWEKVYAGYADARISDTRGFSYDSENTEAIQAALYAIWEGYYAELVTGTVDPDETMAKISDLMYAAGLRELMEEAQRQQVEFLQFQYEELSAARLVDGEQEELEQRSDTMTHSEDIKTALFEAETSLTGGDGNVVGKLKTIASALKGIERVFPDAAEMAERVEGSYIELKDLAQEVSSRLEDIDFDPAELDRVNARLDRIYDLEKKYRVETVASLLEIQKDLQTKLLNIENSDDAVHQLQQQLDADAALCQKKADALTSMRRKAAKQIEQEMRRRLVPLGMPNVRFEVSVTQTVLAKNGQDQVAFLFSANTSTSLQPVSQVASGGEIARVMLALKAMISGAVRLPTIIFDEIDTGVSGKIAEQMAQIMADMGAAERQVISITHLPQIAALGTTHYKVYKEETAHGTTSHMQLLSDEERVAEIAQMLSGSSISDAAIQNAKQLLRL